MSVVTSLEYAYAMCQIRWQLNGLQSTIPGISGLPLNMTSAKYLDGEGSGLLAETVYHRNYVAIAPLSAQGFALHDGSINDPFNLPIAFNRVKAFMLKNVSNELIDGNPATNAIIQMTNDSVNYVEGLGQWVTLDPGGVHFVMSPGAGYLVNASHTDILIENLSAVAAKFAVTIIGSRS